VQVIDDYLGSHTSQSRYASYLGTTRRGTDFSRIDDALRRYTGRSYYYYGGLDRSGFYFRVEHSIKVHRQPVAADVRIIASIWPYYERDHAGHMLPIEAFDWRYGRIRVNDVYDERDYHSGGGATFGHRWYPARVVWDGVWRHFRRALVTAP
jgi:peptidoglycan/xylan/chitin deacetylase (PgdA/CDA1 family)